VAEDHYDWLYEKAVHFDSSMVFWYFKASRKAARKAWRDIVKTEVLLKEAE